MSQNLPKPICCKAYSISSLSQLKIFDLLSIIITLPDKGTALVTNPPLRNIVLGHTMAWPIPLRGQLIIPPHAPRSLESVVASLIKTLTTFIKPNTTVAIYQLRQSTTLPIFFAIARLHAIPVFLNPRYTFPDVSRALSTLPINVFISPPLNPALASTIFRTVPQVLSVTCSHSPFEYRVTSVKYPVTINPPTHHLPTNTAAVFFTSGTTSTPKPVPLTHQNLASQAHAKVSFLPILSSTTYLHLAPLHHLSGFSSTLAVTLCGANHVLPQNLHPSTPAHAASLLSHIRRHHVTLLVAVPTTLRLLLDAAETQSFPSVSTVLYGGSAPSDTLLTQLGSTFHNAQIIGAYGMTETASSLTVCRGTGLSLPLSHVQLAILRDDGQIVETGHGEVVTKGPQVFPGYYGRGEQGFIRGWFQTGDIATLTDRGLTLLGRKVEMIKSGGEKVYAGEVESVLMRHSAVREAAVVGVPDRILGEAVAACVVLVSDMETDMLHALREFCRDSLAHFKCPRWIVASGDLPRNATGKVVKTKVKEILENNLKPRAKL